eukprot:scaffold303823_cov24-Tisochrysis_lutea.AAC.2
MVHGRAVIRPSFLWDTHRLEEHPLVEPAVALQIASLVKSEQLRFASGHLLNGRCEHFGTHMQGHRSIGPAHNACVRLAPASLRVEAPTDNIGSAHLIQWLAIGVLPSAVPELPG